MLKLRFLWEKFPKKTCRKQNWYSIMLEMLELCPRLFNNYTRPIAICSLFILFMTCVEPFSPSLDEQDTQNLLGFPILQINPDYINGKCAR